MTAPPPASESESSRATPRRCRIEDPIQRIALKDGRYSPEAFRFLFESLNEAVRLAGKQDAEGLERHVTGREVLRGMEAHARALFGPLAAQVWRSWGIREPLDWGRIVFLMVEEGLLNRQESDRLEDFDVELDFDEAFVVRYRPRLPDDPDALGSGGLED